MKMIDRTKYRVDRTHSQVTPCGMNSLYYLGASYLEACEAFNKAKLKDDGKGIIMSIWDEKNLSYVVKRTKGFKN